MGLIDYFRAKKPSAKTAKERLQIIIAHERALNSGHEYLPILQKELLEVIQKYINVDMNSIKIELDKHGDCHVLELNIPLPERKRK